MGDDRAVPEPRVESDSLGEVLVPGDAYYGAQTARAAENFPLSGERFPMALIRAMARIKKHMAAVHGERGRLPQDMACAVVRAAEEVLEGAFDSQFILDVFQTGSGTSSHMNVNEVIASRANEILTGKRGGKEPVHPNDHVNRGQSSNDVVPSALHMAAAGALQNDLIPSLALLKKHFNDKSRELMPVIKVGRTHFQDGVPMRMGQEFSGYARQMDLAGERVAGAMPRILELALGGTALGTGLNADPGATREVIGRLARETGLPFREAENHFEAQAARDAAVEVSGVLKAIAVSLMKIAQDIRFFASGPDCGIGEIHLPTLQPGSSFMPGKVNPVICEAVLQAGAQVIGNDEAVTVAAQAGGLDLTTMIPVIAKNLLESIRLISNGARVFAEKCVAGIVADRERCRALAEKTLASATLLAPKTGYDRAARLAHEAHDRGLTVKEVALEQGIITEDEWDRLMEKI